MPNTEADPQSILKSSGFPLQIAIRHAIDGAVRATGWHVRFVEHSWVHPDDREQTGFVDLVAHKAGGKFIAVIECKRPREASWVFVHHTGENSHRRHFQAWVTEYDSEQLKRFGWANQPADPKCLEATFCAVRGQGVGERNPLIERTAGELVLATEALAHSERRMRTQGSRSKRTYFPIIVTTAKLHFARFQPTDVPLDTGELASADLEEVRFLKLRKQLKPCSKCRANGAAIRGILQTTPPKMGT